jgi:uncharacterized phage infection (PIP) family protein YhgE
MAQTGLTEGAYDAVICFPADFSQKIGSVNSKNPAKVVLDYDINHNLPENVYLETYKDLEEFQVNINATISYMYLYSIYNEVHEVQDSSAQLLANDKFDMDALGKVQAYNFAETLNMSDMPEIELVLDEANFETYVNNVRTYAANMSKVYTDSYGDAKNAYQQVMAQLSAQMDVSMVEGTDWMASITNWNSGLQSWLNGANGEVATFNNDISNMNSHLPAYNGKVEALYGYIDETGANKYANAFSQYNAALGTWETKLGEWSNALDTRKNGLDTREIALNATEAALNVREAELNITQAALDAREAELYTSEAALTARKTAVETWIAAINTYLEAENPEGDMPSWEDYDPDTPVPEPDPEDPGEDPEEPEPDLESASASSVADVAPTAETLINTLAVPPRLEDFDSEFAAVRTILNELNIDAFIENLRGVQKDMDSNPLKITEVAEVKPIVPSPSILEISLGKFKNSVDESKRISGLYDPLAYLNEEHKDMVTGISDDYANEISTVQSDLSTRQSDNLARIQDAFDTYNMHIADLREATVTAYQGERDSVAQAVGGFVDTKLATSKDNKQRIADFSSRMPNSRANAAVNKKVVEFVAAPIELNHASIRADRTQESNFPDKWILIALGAFLLILILSIVMRVRTKGVMKNAQS